MAKFVTGAAEFSSSEGGSIILLFVLLAISMAGTYFQILQGNELVAATFGALLNALKSNISQPGKGTTTIVAPEGQRLQVNPQP